ncbi:MAG: radical SAM protein [Deltaproteobacteria bacterium]|nr:radical SAM protein [Deltaproteobacteria bacterium]
MPKTRVFVRSLDLMVTTRCNMSCSNCFGHMDAYPNMDMDMETARKATALYFANRRVGDPRGCQVVLFGGEPTLCWDFVAGFVPWLHQTHPREELGYATSIFTNGTLLSRDKLDFLMENQVGVGLSFDGPFAQHVLRRKMAPQSYENLLNAARYLLDQGYAERLLVSTVLHPASLDHLDDFFALYASMGLTQFQFIQDSDNPFSPDDRNRLDAALREYKQAHPGIRIYLCPEYAFHCDTCMPGAMLVYPNGEVWDMCTLTTSMLHRTGRISEEQRQVTCFGMLDEIEELWLDVAQKIKVVRRRTFCPTLSRDWRMLLRDFGEIPA